MSPIIIFLAEYLTTKFLDWITDKKLKEIPFSDIDISILTQNKELKDLLLNSIEIAMRNEKIKQLDENDIKNSLNDNMHFVFEWILLSERSNISFQNYSDKIIYSVNEDVFRMLYKSLFHQIQSNKNNYSTLQNLMILDKLDMLDSKLTSLDVKFNKRFDQLFQTVTNNNVEYTDELKEIENLIKSRQLKKARTLLAGFEHKILGKGEAEEIEKYYQLLTDSYLYDTENQHETINPLEKLIIHTTDNKKRKRRELLKYLLEEDFNTVQKELDIIFSDSSDIDKSYLDIQINIFINQKKFDEAIHFVQKHKETINEFPLWVCRLFYYQSNTIKAKQIIDENDDFFKKPDFYIQTIKISVLATFYLERAIYEISFQNNENIKMIIPDIEEVINICGDDFGEKSNMHSILGLIYSVLGDIDNARKEYEKSIELNNKNINTLRNFPFILLNSNKKRDKERALEYISLYLSLNPEDKLIEDLYYNALVFISPQKAVIELQNYNGENDDIKPFLIFAYDVTLEYTKAEELVFEYLAKHDISSSMYFFIGLHFEAAKKYNIALDYYFKAIDKGKTNGELDRTVDKILQLTILLKDIILIKKGINIIEKTLTLDEIILRFINGFSCALILSNEYEKCYSYCESALQNGIRAKCVYEALFCCYYNTGNLQFALEIVEQYINVFGQPLPHNHLQSIAVCYIRIGKIEKANNIIQYLPHPESVNDYLSQILFFVKINRTIEAINIAHEAYLTFPKNQYIMEQFIHLCMLNKGNNVLSENVANDLQQCFSNYISSDIPDKMLKEYKIDTKSGPEELRKQISAILPESTDFTDRFDSIEKDRLPVSFYKYVLGRNILIIYYFLISQKKYKIWCFDGSLNIIKSSSSIYIDIGSLLSLDTFNLLDTLPKIFSEIYIIQPIFDELFNFKSEMPQTDGKLLLNKDKNGNLVITEDTIPYKEILDKSERIIAFINNNKSVKLVGRPLKIVNKPIQDLSNFINSSKSNNDFSIVEYGYLSNNPVMLESILSRSLFNSFNTQSKAFGIVDYLRFLVSIENISFIKYCQILSLMAKQNYAILPFDYNVIYCLIKNNGYIIDDSIIFIFDIFCSDDYNKEYSYKHIIAIIVVLWNDMIHNEIKYKWTDYLMDKLISYYNLQLKNIIAIYHSISSRIYNIKSQKDFVYYFDKYLSDVNDKQI